MNLLTMLPPRLDGPAACRDHDPELWFPWEDKGRPGSMSASLKRAEKAKTICWGCPVAAECLRDALRRNERDGIWGGANRGLQSARERYQSVTLTAHKLGLDLSTLPLPSDEAAWGETGGLVA